VSTDFSINLRREVAKYRAFARVGLAGARAEPGKTYAGIVFLFVILGVFSALWRAVGAGGSGSGTRETMVWYLAMTEWVLFSAPLLHFDVEADVRRGDVAYQIARPVSYLGSHLARGIGAMVLRAPVLLAAACAAGVVFGGRPPHPAAIVRIVVIGAAAAVVMSAWYVSIGLLAFWLGDIAPVYWIWQKLTFVLGGLLLPLSFYPDVVVRIATFTPFPALLTGPASFVLGRPLFGTIKLLGLLTLWFVVASVLAVALFRRATRTLQLNGG
jgi:viologen exporter family transport system permease protein